MAKILPWQKIFVCFNPSCDCLYYSAWQWISQAHCNKPVGFKQGKPPRPWCYCFGYTEEEILQSMNRRGASPLLKQIEEYIAKGGNLCEHTHPAGQCCLNFVRNLRSSLPPRDPTPDS